MMKPAALALVLALAPAAASAETWMVIEGADGKVKGSWTVTAVGPAINGAASMKDGRGMTISYRIAGNAQGGNYVLQRMSPSDSVACDYIGKAAGPKAINGVAKCGRASAPWKVVKTN